MPITLLSEEYLRKNYRKDIVDEWALIAKWLDPLVSPGQALKLLNVAFQEVAVSVVVFAHSSVADLKKVQLLYLITNQMKSIIDYALTDLNTRIARPKQVTPQKSESDRRWPEENFNIEVVSDEKVGLEIWKSDIENKFEKLEGIGNGIVDWDQDEIDNQFAQLADVSNERFKDIREIIYRIPLFFETLNKYGCEHKEAYTEFEKLCKQFVAENEKLNFNLLIDFFKNIVLTPENDLFRKRSRPKSTTISSDTIKKIELLKMFLIQIKELIPFAPDEKSIEPWIQKNLEDINHLNTLLREKKVSEQEKLIKMTETFIKITSAPQLQEVEEKVKLPSIDLLSTGERKVEKLKLGNLAVRLGKFQKLHNVKSERKPANILYQGDLDEKVIEEIRGIQKSKNIDPEEKQKMILDLIHNARDKNTSCYRKKP